MATVMVYSGSNGYSDGCQCGTHADAFGVRVAAGTAAKRHPVDGAAIRIPEVKVCDQELPADALEAKVLLNEWGEGL